MADRTLILPPHDIRGLRREVTKPRTGKVSTRVILTDVVPPAPAMDSVSPRNPVRHDAPYLDAYCCQLKTPANPRGMSGRWCWWTRDDRPGRSFTVPFVPGDRIWIAETWAVGNIYDGMSAESINPGGKPGWCGIRYAATDERIGIYDRAAETMPRWASRFTLWVTDVGVQRLQDITGQGALHEGMTFQAFGAGDAPGCDPLDSFITQWNAVHGRDAWATNPWVAHVRFTVHRANIDAGDAREDAA